MTTQRKSHIVLENGPTLTVSCDFDGLLLSFRKYRLQAFYETDDGTVVIDNDYTDLMLIPTPDDWRQFYRDAMRADAGGWQVYLVQAILTLLMPILLTEIPYYYMRAVDALMNGLMNLAERSPLFSKIIMGP